MLPPIGTPTLATATPLERNARTEAIIQKFNETLKEANAKETEVMAEAKRRDIPNQPIYALIYKGDQVVGYLTKDALGAFINGGIFDMEAMGQSQTAQGRADWIEANAAGLTVKRFPEGTKAPKVKEADAMMNKTAAIWARDNPIRSSAPEPDATKTEMALRMKNLDVSKAQKLLSTEPQTTAERWQRNIDWFKADHSA